ncbi:MAG TPA: VWA domain-containing protein, partial [Polyangia bacterium]
MCVLFLAGVSCRYKVDLPGMVQDAAGEEGGRKATVDAGGSFDLPFSGERPAQTGDYCGMGLSPWMTQKVKLIFVLDRSASMQQHPFDGTQSRYSAAKQSILSAMKSHPNIEFGLDIFPQNPYQCMQSAGNPSAIPDVQPYANTQALIEGQLALCSPDGGCPAYAN